MTQRNTPASASAKDLAAMTAVLERMLRAQLEDHQTLLKCLERKRQAIRNADVAAVEVACVEEEPIARRVIESQQHLKQVRERLTNMMRGPHSQYVANGGPPQARAPMTLSEIAIAAGGEHQSNLTALAAQLRETVTQVKRQSAIVRAAAEALGRHLGGIVQTVNSALSRARVYGNRGRIALGAPVSSNLDIKS